MFWDILFYGIIIIGAALLIGLTVYRIDWARHPEKYKDLVEDPEKAAYRQKKEADKKAAAKKAKDWATADAIRAQLTELGWAVKDTAQGPQLSKL